jgi:hypothetical protein
MIRRESRGSVERVSTGIIYKASVVLPQNSKSGLKRRRVGTDSSPTLLIVQTEFPYRRNHLLLRSDLGLRSELGLEWILSK